MTDLAIRVKDSERTGRYFRVSREGRVQAESRLMLLERPFPESTVASANDVMHCLADDIRGTDKLQGFKQLTVRWRILHKRVETKPIGGALDGSRAPI